MVAFGGDGASVTSLEESSSDVLEEVLQEESTIIDLVDGKLLINLQQYVDMVAGKAISIQSSRLDLEQARLSVGNELGVFDPEITLSVTRDSINERNTVQEALTRSSLSEFIQYQTKMEAGISKKFSTGTEVSLTGSMAKLNQNIQPDFLRGEERVFYAGVSLTQSLLKDAGKASAFGLRQAEKQVDIAQQEFREAASDEVLKAVNAYWDLYTRQESLQAKVGNLESLESLYQNGKELVLKGRMSANDLLILETRLFSAKTLVNNAYQEAQVATQELKKYIAVSALAEDYLIELASEGIDYDSLMSLALPEADLSMQRVLLSNPEYIASKLRAEREQIRLVYAKNQKLPELDLIASYGVNGLGTSSSGSSSDAFEGDHPSWSVGVVFKTSLFNQKAKSQYGIASAQKQQALLAIKENEIRLANDVASQALRMNTHYENALTFSKIQEINDKMYKAAKGSFERGLIGVNQLIESEQRCMQSTEKTVRSVAEYQKSLYGMKRLEGALEDVFNMSEFKVLQSAVGIQ
ncbi:TolC family protein [Pseudomonadota bacterium]|nr:TolC family protein [Pseudomonadota bacterium]